LRLILMPIILIFVSSAALAAPGLDVRPGVDFDRDEDVVAVEEMARNFENLQTRTMCEGPPACQEFRSEDTCLDLGENNSCFWSYE